MSIDFNRSSPKNVYLINKHVVIIKLLGIRLVKLWFDGLRFLLVRAGISPGR